MFRKIADVLREKELAERDRNDPPVELSTDHPVRKLISRFRKMSCSRLPSISPGITLNDLSPTDAMSLDLHALASRKVLILSTSGVKSSRPKWPRGQTFGIGLGLGALVLASASASASSIWLRPGLDLVVLLCNRAFFGQKSCKVREFCQFLAIILNSMLLIIIWYFFHNYFWPRP